MIERYTIKSSPAVPHKDILKRLDEIKDGDTDGLRKLQSLKVRIELICETADIKRITVLLKDLTAQ